MYKGLLSSKNYCDLNNIVSMLKKYFLIICEINYY